MTHREQRIGRKIWRAKVKYRRRRLAFQDTSDTSVILPSSDNGQQLLLPPPRKENINRQARAAQQKSICEKLEDQNRLLK